MAEGKENNRQAGLNTDITLCSAASHPKTEFGYEWQTSGPHNPFSHSKRAGQYPSQSFMGNSALKDKQVYRNTAHLLLQDKHSESVFQLLSQRI